MSQNIFSSPQLLTQNAFYQVIKINSLVIINVYLPTDYGDEKSEQKFALACKKIGRELREQWMSGLQVMIIGDFNCNLEDKP